MCGWCGLVDGYYPSRDVSTLKLILAQLGTSDGRNEDPMLSQLG
jgi:hypothetical protein